MQEVELYYDGSTPVSHTDAGGLVPTTATCTLTKADGTAVGTYAVTLPALSTTTQAGTTATQLVLASVAGLAVGDRLRVVSDGVTYVCRVARIDGTTVHLAEALPLVVDVGATVKALKMTATVTAPGASLVGPHLRLTWVYDDGSTDRRVGVPASVVRWPWTPPVSTAKVREVLAASYGESRRGEPYIADVADRANAKIHAMLSQTGRRPWLFLSSAVFFEAADKAVRFVLAENGFVMGPQPAEWIREIRFQFDDAMKAVIAGSAGYDDDADGKLSGREQTPAYFMVQTSR